MDTEEDEKVQETKARKRKAKSSDETIKPSKKPRNAALKTTSKTAKKQVSKELGNEADLCKLSENIIEPTKKTKKAASKATALEIELWNEADVLCKTENVPKPLADNFIKLLSDGCTLPFIARYRKSAVDNLMPDRLQELYESYTNICNFKKKVKSTLETLKSSCKLTPELTNSILSARNLNELDLIYAPLKTNTVSLAERARKLGLETYAVKALNKEYVNLKSICRDDDEELDSEEKVATHLTHIVADIIYRDARVLEEMRALNEKCRFTLQSSLNKNCLKPKEEDANKKKDTKSDPETYKLYFDWKCPTQFVKPHQMLALNRGADEKILSVKVVIPDWYLQSLERFCIKLWPSSIWVKKGLEDAYKRLIKPWLSRQVRSNLTTIAHKEAVRTFTANLEKYLLTEPIKNRRILGLDPGFKAGCKVGVIDLNGQKLDAFTIFPDFRRFNERDQAAKQLKEVIEEHNVEVIGLGNGTACRETESWLKQHGISAALALVIVPEQGASVYSISKEALKEHPNMDPNLISALSIARRVLDPLGELIKVDPKNLGVGMYQHDISAKMLDSALELTVEKVVSLLGVDINTASQPLLRRISGLNDSRAQKLISHRTKSGGFTSRADILKVAGIGKVTFQQCAGFLKVLGGNEPLDNTVVHPESYAVAKAFAKKLGINLKDINKPDFPALMETKTSSINLVHLSAELGTETSNMELIVNALKRKNMEDGIIKFCKPVYSVAVCSLEQLREGMTLTGVVRNVVPFGCFVDCGVGDNGLIHRSNMAAHESPKLGDRVQVNIVAPPRPKKLQLKLIRILDDGE